MASRNDNMNDLDTVFDDVLPPDHRSGVVAVVGRPNVGKSTLFNRLTESRQAIVDEQSGVTRDRHYGFAEWGGKKFSVSQAGPWEMIKK